ncbi:MAG TPA: HPF/RaiA family ribosome-associated protein [Bacteriovoracaceae bacterium]|nr:HPF/RaiA family ribosome-associated protein [Bacteriovoracaceae bacterium]
MNIQVNTDRNTQGGSELNKHVVDVLTGALERFTGQITRVEVHLGDENGDKVSQNDKKCLIEARLAHIKPIVVSHKDMSIHQAIDGASDKLVRAIDSYLGKLTDHSKPENIWSESDVEDSGEEAAF